MAGKGKGKRRDGVGEGVKIRHFVMNLIYRSAGRSVRIPSLTALAERFGIARSTAQLAVERMVADEYLVARHGSGVFTNPRMGFIGPAPLPLVGVKVDHGDHFFYDLSVWSMVEAVGRALTRRNGNLRLIGPGDTSSGAGRGDPRDGGLDGMIFVRGDAAEVATAADRVPAAAIWQPPEGVDGVRFSFGNAAKALKRMLRSRRGRVLTLVSMRETRRMSRDTLAALVDHGFDLSRATVFDVHREDFSAALRETLAGETFDLVLTHGQLASCVAGILRERGVSAEACPVVSLEEWAAGEGEEGFMIRVPWAGAAEWAAERVMGRIAAGRVDAPHEQVEMDAEMARV